MEKGETAEEAARRELKEELDIEMDMVKYLGMGEFTDNQNILQYHWYLAKIKTGIPKLMESKFDKIGYFSKEELAKLEEASPNMKVLIQTINLWEEE